MDKGKIIKFSDTVREKLLHEVKERAAFYGIHPKEVLPVDSEHSDSIVIGGKVFNRKIKDQREDLVKEVKLKGYAQVMDEVTYTWFNRFVALKFMEVNDYIQVKVFTSEDSERIEPGIITHALEMNFLDIDSDDVLDMKADNKDEELYKYLILKLCNYLNKTMPFMFEKIEDYTELLFPENLLHIDSIVKDINEIIPEDDWREVEIIGWIYQYYIAPRKEKVFKSLKKNVKITRENIPAATQLFTPHWIVRYLVENSLGRLWMLNRPSSSLYEKMDYYIKPDEPETDFLKVSSPEDIKVCDPACGSGHMLVYAFELLYTIYEEEGYDSSEIPEKILAHNLYGIEIDKRAGVLAAFALTMKARRKNRKFFQNPVQPNICVLESVSFEEGELNAYTDSVGSELFTNDIRATLLQFNEADNFGSLIRPKAEDVSDILKMLESKNLSDNLTLLNTHQNVLKALKQADYLSPKYHVVVANPPYMGSKGMNTSLKDFAKKDYPNSKSDFFAMFIERGFDLNLDDGYNAMVTMQSWMFLSSFEKMRGKMLDEVTIECMVHMGNMVMGIAFGTAATVWSKSYREDYKGFFCYVGYDDIGPNGKPVSFPPFNERNKAAGLRSVANDSNMEVR
jgi:phage anti-repressor protein